MFRTVPLSTIRSFSLYTQQCYMSYRFADRLQAGTGRNRFRPVPARVSSWSCSQAISKSLWRRPLLCLRWKTPDDGQRNSPKHAKFYSKNKFEKLVHLVRDRGSKVVKVLCYKSEGRCLDPSWCQWIFLWHKIPQIEQWHWGRLSLWQKWVPGLFLGGKGGRCIRLTTLPPSCAVVTNSGSLNFLESSGPL